MNTVRSLAVGLLDAVLPQTCVGCGTWIASGRGAMCADCQIAIEKNAAMTYCPRCARSMLPVSIHEGHCARCKSERFWNTAGIARIGAYDDPLPRMIVQLKFGGARRYAEFLGAQIAAAIRKQDWAAQIDLLVPVPMHPLRRVQRPCNHAYELTECVGRALDVPVRTGAVRHARYVRSQMHSSSRLAKLANVMGCFAPGRRPDVAGRTVCIVDNLIVSGATISEVSKALRKAGAERIYAAVAARTTMPSDFQSSGPPSLA